MALRVLLADESSTIKKVFQLALQDFAVEVRPVNIGLDVMPVAKTFKPDIVFADVLLQKKSGYEVCMELKNDGELGKVPVVLMWSGFMELDEDKFQASLANGKLEKPFDVTALRKLVSDLVPKTQSQRMSQFLSFPKMPELEEKPGARAPAPAAPAAPAEPEEFKRISIQKMKGPDKFHIPAIDDSDLPVDLKEPTGPIDVQKIFNESEEPEEFSVRESKPKVPPAAMAPPPLPAAPKAAAAPAAAPPPQIPKLSEADLEKIIRAQSQEVIESIVWKVVPELAQQIIEREIQKLLKEKDGSLHR